MPRNPNVWYFYLIKWLGDLEDHTFTLNCKTIENISEHCYLGVDS